MKRVAVCGLGERRDEDMTVAITRTEHTATALRRHAACSANASVVRRLLALALILDGHKRADAARSAGVKPRGLPDMDRQTLRDWVHRYNADGLADLGDRHGGGAQPWLSPEQKAEVAGWMRTGPDVAVDGVVHWRCVDKGRHQGGLMHSSGMATQPGADPGFPVNAVAPS